MVKTSLSFEYACIDSHPVDGWFDIVEYSPSKSRKQENIILNNYVNQLNNYESQRFMILRELEVESCSLQNKKCTYRYQPYTYNQIIEYFPKIEEKLKLFRPIKFEINKYQQKYFVSDKEVIDEKNNKIKNLLFCGLADTPLYLPYDIKYMDIFDPNEIKNVMSVLY